MVMGVRTSYLVGSTLTDKSKGSLNNRVNCVAEHMKNDIKTGVPITVAGAAAGLVAYKKPGFAVKIAKYIGQGIGKAGKFISEKLFKGRGLGTGLLNKILKNPTKAGAIGLLAAGGAWVLNKLLKHSYNAGQIDQKYTDAAILEGQSKNIILER